MSIKLSAAVNRIYNGFVRAGALLAGLLIIFIMLSVTMDVVLRYFFGRPTSWVVEISGYGMLFIPFLVAAWVLKRDNHVKMDLLLNRLSSKTQLLVNTLTCFVSALICLLLTWHGMRVALYFFKVGYKTPTVLMLPKSILVAIIFVGFFFLSIQFFISAYGHLRTWREFRSGAR
jgi:TRAP-type C4-dicarboxylate transport system permease small subunit